MRQIFYLFRQTLKRKGFRVWVMIASILLASATLFVAVSLSRGIQSTMQTAVERLGADLVAVPADSRDEAQAALVSGSPTIFYMDSSLEERVRNTPGVRQTCAQLFLRSLSAPCCDSEVSLVGFDPERDFTIMPWALKQLSPPLQGSQIIVGAKVISAVVGTPSKAIGQRLVFMGKPLSVATILEPTGLGADYTVFLTMDTAYQMTQDSPLYPLPVGRDKISTILVRLEERVDLAAAARAVEKSVPEVRVFTADQLVSSYGRQLQGVVKIFFAAGGIFGSLASILAASLFGLSVRQRMREFGLFLAMGARRNFIFRLIVLEAVCIAGIGGLLGVLLGLGVVFFGQERLAALLGSFYVWAGSPYFFKTAALMLLAVLVLGVLGGLYPAWRVSRIEPYEAIRRGE